MYLDLPRETLIALLIQKDLQLKPTKLLAKDRKSFLTFCKHNNVNDAELIFESAAAQNVPILLADLTPTKEPTEKKEPMFECTLPFEVLDSQIRAQQARIEWLESRPVSSFCNLSASTQVDAPVLEPKGVQTDTPLGQNIGVQAELLTAINMEEILKLEISDLKKKISEKESLSFLEEMAEKQSNRDMQVAELKKELERAKFENKTDLDSMNKNEFLKNLIIKFISYSVTLDYSKMSQLVPVVKQVLSLSDSDAEELLSVCRGPSIWKF